MDAIARVDYMTKDERTLLLYLESRAVDNGGLVSGLHMNAGDFETARKWAAAGFIRFSRILAEHLGTGSGVSHVVELTDESWAAAGEERKRRGKRSQRSDIVQPSLAHFESHYRPTQV